MRKFFESITWHITIWDAVPDAVGYRGLVYWQQNITAALKHIYRPALVENLVYKNRPTLDFVPRGKR